MDDYWQGSGEKEVSLQQRTVPFQQGRTDVLSYCRRSQWQAREGTRCDMFFLYAEQGVCDTIMLSSRGRGQKLKQHKKPNVGRTGAEDWSLSLEGVSKLISQTARAQSLCHDAFFIKSSSVWTHRCLSSCQWPGQAQRGWTSSGNRWTPTQLMFAAEPANPSSFKDNAEKPFFRETLPAFLEMMKN